MNEQAPAGTLSLGGKLIGNLRFAVDTGGTFTDLIVSEAGRTLSMYKAPTTPEDPASA